MVYGVPNGPLVQAVMEGRAQESEEDTRLPGRLSESMFPTYPACLLALGIVFFTQHRRQEQVKRRTVWKASKFPIVTPSSPYRNGSVE